MTYSSYGYDDDDGLVFGVLAFGVIIVLAVAFALWLGHVESIENCHQNGGVVVNGHCVKENK